MSFSFVFREKLLLFLVLGEYLCESDNEVSLILAHLMAFSLEGKQVQVRIAWLYYDLLLLSLRLDSVSIQGELLSLV